MSADRKPPSALALALLAALALNTPVNSVEATVPDDMAALLARIEDGEREHADA